MKSTAFKSQLGAEHLLAQLSHPAKLLKLSFPTCVPSGKGKFVPPDTFLLTVAMASLGEKGWSELGLWKGSSRTKPMTPTLRGSYRHTKDSVATLGSHAHEQMKA